MPDATEAFTALACSDLTFDALFDRVTAADRGAHAPVSAMDEACRRLTRAREQLDRLSPAISELSFHARQRELSGEDSSAVLAWYREAMAQLKAEDERANQ